MFVLAWIGKGVLEAEEVAGRGMEGGFTAGTKLQQSARMSSVVLQHDGHVSDRCALYDS